MIPADPTMVTATAKAASGTGVGRIRLLPEQVANQIAAGEVVERPASVVKELVENALDAGSSRITIEVQAGGRSLIRVTDDGIGMNRDDALLCLERHATSKIRKAEDLSGILTMGFRGEALPSIASVGRMILTTRERTSEATPVVAGTNGLAATQVVIHGGRIIEVREAGAPSGTSVEIRQLFFNLPARRRFLRSDETEFAHVQHYVTLAALAHPGIAFTFVKDGRTIWQLAAVPGADDPQRRIEALRQRVRGLLGSEDRLLAVDFTADIPRSGLSDAARDPENEETDAAMPVPSNQVRLWGLIGQPGVSRSTREDQHVFVNRRPVENRGLNFALAEGYHTALMKGRFPVCCLFLEIDPALVDVNIHPSKREVKFHNERAVRQRIAQAVRDVLLAYHGEGPAASELASPSSARATGVEPATILPPSSEVAPKPTELPGFTALSGTSLGSGQRVASSPTARADNRVPSAGSPDRFSPSVSSPTNASDRPMVSTGSMVSRPPEEPGGAPKASDPAVRVERAQPFAAASPLLSIPLRLVGVIGRLYVVLESDRGLVLMDQHAAHERILFEQMIQRVESGTVPSQRLLLPETVELSPRDAAFLRDQMATLNRLGVGLSEFGERTFLLDSVPPMVKLAEARRFVIELVDELKAAGQTINSQRLGEDTIAKTVCRHAVKANDPLSEPELANLVEDLRHCAMPYTCPHGRPTLIEMSYRELEKKFGRQA